MDFLTPHYTTKCSLVLAGEIPFNHFISVWGGYKYMLEPSVTIWAVFRDVEFAGRNGFRGLLLCSVTVLSCCRAEFEHRVGNGKEGYSRKAAGSCSGFVPFALWEKDMIKGHLAGPLWGLSGGKKPLWTPIFNGRAFRMAQGLARPTGQDFSPTQILSVSIRQHLRCLQEAVLGHPGPCNSVFCMRTIS